MLEIPCSYCKKIKLKPASSYLDNKLSDENSIFYCDMNCYKKGRSVGLSKRRSIVYSDEEIDSLVEKYRQKLIDKNIVMIEKNAVISKNYRRA